MKRIVITGATGFIGVHLIEKWIERDTEVFAVIRPDSKNAERLPQNDKVHLIELKMGEYDRLPEIIGTADFFYHLAWEGARVPFRDDALMQENNYNCAIQAYEAAKELRCSFFLGAGSQAEYGSTTGLVNEEYPCNPTTEYGKQKLNAGKMLLKRAESDAIRVIWTRIFSIYGPYDFPGSLVMTVIDKMLNDKPVEMTEGTQLWDYLFVSDVAEAMVLLAAEECEAGIYNVASGNYKPLGSFVEEIKTILHSKSDIRFGAVSYGPHGPVNMTPNSNKLKALGWSPAVSFEAGIREIVKQKRKICN